MIRINVQVKFYSHLDETAFFRWAKKIPCIERFDPITLFIKSKELSEVDLRDLTALLYRYKASMIQLRQFCNRRNEHWFKNKKKYWYRRVFGAT
jgi:hypothetical protein